MWPLFFDTLQASASDGELKRLARDLLGQSVRATAGLIPAELVPSAEQKRLLHYLEKPRKPDQLERAMKNRRLVRGMLRALTLIGALDTLPVKKAIPIPKATLLKGQHGIAEFTPPPRETTPSTARSSTSSETSGTRLRVPCTPRSSAIP